MNKLFLIMTVLLLTCSTVFAKSASETATDYFSVLRQKDYDRAAAFFDPNALGAFRQMMSFMSEIPKEAQEEVYTTFFGAGANKESIAKMSNARFFASFLRFIMASADEAGGLKFGKVDILGEVMEGKDVAHVVTRSNVSVGDIEVEAMEVVSFKKHGKEWKTLLSGNIKGLANQLKKSLTPH
jgi:hypothetical protein